LRAEAAALARRAGLLREERQQVLEGFRARRVLAAVLARLRPRARQRLHAGLQVRDDSLEGVVAVEEDVNGLLRKLPDGDLEREAVPRRDLPERLAHGARGGRAR